MEDIKAKKMKSVVETMNEMPKEAVEKSLHALDELKEGVVIAGGYSGIGKSLLLEQLKEAGQTIDKGEEVLFEDNRTLEDIIAEVAEQEGMTPEQVMAMFRKGLKEANNYVTPVDPKKKKKARAKNKQAKKSRKRNR